MAGTLRAVVLFALGVLVVLDAIAGPKFRLGEFVLGLILLGVVPVDLLLSRLDRDR